MTEQYHRHIDLSLHRLPLFQGKFHRIFFLDCRDVVVIRYHAPALECPQISIIFTPDSNKRRSPPDLTLDGFGVSVLQSHRNVGTGIWSATTSAWALCAMEITRSVSFRLISGHCRLLPSPPDCNGLTDGRNALFTNSSRPCPEVLIRTSGCLWAYRSAPPVPSGLKSASQQQLIHIRMAGRLRGLSGPPCLLRFPVLREWRIPVECQFCALKGAG